MTAAGALRRLAMLAAVVLEAVVVPSGVATAAESSAPRPPSATLGPWSLQQRYLVSSPFADEGLATITPGHLYYTGPATIPLPVALRGWTHIGDPDIAEGYRFDDYQSGRSAPTDKMFRVRTPSGAHYEYAHQLVPGEALNNSWVAISPDGQWMVNGEWGTMRRFLVFPTPVLNPATPRRGGALSLAAGQITLDRPVRDVQGCDFVTATRLVCTADDNGTDLFPTPKQLLRVDLDRPLSGRGVVGHVRSLGELPLRSSCSGTPSDYEVEGDDYDPATGTLRVEVIPPSACELVTAVYAYRRQ